ncbi:PucR family transcriptional regulator [Mycolicibacterium litorale]|uniref:Transcriptional regulator n=1 Tax=Mycolicibacterium litorale TaxID=758802 RepID=A0AAD1II68_9MYCO|nr:helix-turn-helix domain-containing protein [Mycolicibacterium litorale]MCV7418834.1 helix-turn-helix domain-containing protein [Mycolicibacterium litorale]TDY00382.1 DNA-binding PucR family transcriptional regulator [Mycolicibacterium litorale]BBY15785.1 transcriptional regulator [Mycolicibacterium litorale]
MDTTLSPPDAAETLGGIPASDILRLLGDLVTVTAPAPDGDLGIRSVGVLDGSLDECPDLLLVIGAAPADWAGLITRSAEGGVRVVVLGPVSGDDRALIGAAGLQAGVCVLERRADVPWLTLSDLIRERIRVADTEQIRGSGVALEDLAGVAESLAEMLGGHVIIEDAKFRVLSYSSSTGQVDRGRDIAILGRRIPDDWLRHLESLGVIDTLLGTDEVVTVEDGPFEARRRLLCSIRAERFLLGVLWVAEGETPLPGDIRERMITAARTAAPFLLRHQEAGFQRRAAQNRQTRLLLDQGTIAQSTAEEYGLSPADRYTVFGLRASPDALLTNLDRNRTVESVALYCQSYRWRAATTTIGHTVYCVLAHDAETSAGRLSDLAAAVGEHVRRALLGRGVQVALSRTVRALQDIPTARGQVDEVLETCSPAKRLTVTSFDDALATIALSRVGQFMTANAIDHPKLERLRAEDQATGSEYTATLTAYLSAFGNVVAAARQLNVHVTTLRYRLKRIQAISGLDFDDPAERLLCELLLR